MNSALSISLIRSPSHDDSEDKLRFLQSSSGRWSEHAFKVGFITHSAQNWRDCITLIQYSTMLKSIIEFYFRINSRRTGYLFINTHLGPTNCSINLIIIQIVNSTAQSSWKVHSNSKILLNFELYKSLPLEKDLLFAIRCLVVSETVI